MNVPYKIDQGPASISEQMDQMSSYSLKTSKNFENGIPAGKFLLENRNRENGQEVPLPASAIIPVLFPIPDFS